MAQTTDVKMTLIENGPIMVEGELSLADGQGNTHEIKGKGALCRCGASGNKPYCDGSHAKVGFESN